ncbi:hypothetical protein RYX36_015610 [Vicia faba]
MAYDQQKNTCFKKDCGILAYYLLKQINLDIIREFFAMPYQMAPKCFGNKKHKIAGGASSSQRRIGPYNRNIFLGPLQEERFALSCTRHGELNSCQLTYPWMIMGLCKKARVKIPTDDHQVIDGMINDNFVDHFCTPREEVPAAEVVSVASTPPVHPSFNSGSEHSWSMHEAHQRAFLFMHYSMQQLDLNIKKPQIDHPLRTRDELIAYANWP